MRVCVECGSLKSLGMFYCVINFVALPSVPSVSAIVEKVDPPRRDCQNHNHWYCQRSFLENTDRNHFKEILRGACNHSLEYNCWTECTANYYSIRYYESGTRPPQLQHDVYYFPLNNGAAMIRRDDDFCMAARAGQMTDFGCALGAYKERMGLDGSVMAIKQYLLCALDKPRNVSDYVV